MRCKLKTVVLAGLMTLASFHLALSQQNEVNTKPRIVITADPELDDNNSLIRLILYSSDLKIEGLIYASSQFHWKGDGKGTLWQVPNREYNRFGLSLCPCESWRWAKDERFIHDIVEAYEKVYSNLKVHDPGYPAPAELKSVIRYGNINFDGDISEDSPGSDLIKQLIMDNKPGQLYITSWGGFSTISRALKSIQEQYQNTTDWEAIRKKIARKVVLLPSGDQDDTYATYIKPNWPEIEYRQFRSGPNYGYGAQLRASKDDAPYLTSTWMKSNINGKGPLGSLYRVWGDGKQMVKGDKMDYFGLSGYTDEELRKKGYIVWMPVQEKGSWLGEGDNHTFMNMLGNGLRAYEAGFYGGWGGRSEKGMRDISFTMEDTSAQAMVNALTQGSGAPTSYPNFFPAAQADFAARLKWSTTSRFKSANHPPVVKVVGPLVLKATPGQKFQLMATASDPDGDKLFIKWWHFQMPDFSEWVSVNDAGNGKAEIEIPKTAKPGLQLHFIVEASDPGGLVRYQRVVVLVR